MAGGSVRDGRAAFRYCLVHYRWTEWVFRFGTRGPARLVAVRSLSSPVGRRGPVSRRRFHCLDAVALIVCCDTPAALVFRFSSLPFLFRFVFVFALRKKNEANLTGLLDQIISEEVKGNRKLVPQNLNTQIFLWQLSSSPGASP